jgi:3-methyladenine DNA glycosylase AlkC
LGHVRYHGGSEDDAMAEPLKLIYNPPFVRQFGELVQSVHQPFDVEAFCAGVMDDTWDALELKARMRRITEVLGALLPRAYEEALGVLFAIDGQCHGFPYLFFPDFVEVFGAAPEHWSLSMKALERFTAGSSAEFAIRPFLLRDPERGMAQMLAWTSHPSEHVRRLASEGCRPRLPWAPALPMFKVDPSPILPVLERLKEDESLYVRKSVANNLNDIAKDHPQRVTETVKAWKGRHPSTDWIIRHGSRSLIRQADPTVMAIFGYAAAGDDAPLTASAELTVAPASLSIGEESRLAYTLQVRDGGEPVRLRVEYAIDFVKANGKTARKQFLLSDKTCAGGSVLQGTRRHSWAELTTRKHYPGLHRIVLLVNGRETAWTALDLSRPDAR